MSNKLRRTGKGDKAPAVRRNEFNNTVRQLEQKIYQLHMGLVETSYMVRSTSASIYNFVEFLTKKGVVVKEEYEQFLEEQKQKSNLAEEIRKDGALSREEKIAKAKENDIPESWVVEPEAPAEDEEKPPAEVESSSEQG